MSKALRNRCLEIFVSQSYTVHPNLSHKFTDMPSINILQIAVQLTSSCLQQTSSPPTPDDPILIAFHSHSFKALQLMLRSLQTPFLSPTISPIIHTLFDSFLLLYANRYPIRFSLTLAFVRFVVDLFFCSFINFLDLENLKAFIDSLDQIKSQGSCLSSLDELILLASDLSDSLRAQQSFASPFSTSVKPLFSKSSLLIKRRLLDPSSSMHLLQQWASAAIVAQSIMISGSKDDGDYDWRIFDVSYCSPLFGGEEATIQIMMKSCIKRLFQSVKQSLQLEQWSFLWNQFCKLMIELHGCCHGGFTSETIPYLSAFSQIDLSYTTTFRILVSHANKLMADQQGDGKSNPDGCLKSCVLRQKCWKDLSCSVGFVFERLRSTSWTRFLKLVRMILVQYKLNDAWLQHRLNAAILALEKYQPMFSSIESELDAELKSIMKRSNGEEQLTSSMSVPQQVEAMLFSPPVTLSQEQIQRLVSYQFILSTELHFAVAYPGFFHLESIPNIDLSFLGTKSLFDHSPLSLWDAQLFLCYYSSSSSNNSSTNVPLESQPQSIIQAFRQSVDTARCGSDLDLQTVITTLHRINQLNDLQNRHCLLCNVSDPSIKPFIRRLHDPIEIISLLINNQWQSVQCSILPLQRQPTKSQSVGGALQRPSADLLCLRPAYSCKIEFLLESSVYSIYQLSLRYGYCPSSNGASLDGWNHPQQLFESIDVVATLRCLNAIK